MSKQLLQAAALLATVPMAAAQSVEVFVDPGAGAPQTFGNGTDDAVPALHGVPFAMPGDPTLEIPDYGASVPLSTGMAKRAAQIHYTQHESGMWVRGTTYKACVNEAGFTYIPFLGSDAPRNFPTKFRLESATLAGRELLLNRAGDVSQEGDRMVIDRGPVEVVYDFELESVEQSFVLDAAGAAGDLVLQLDVDSDLGAGTAGEGFRFQNDLGGMDYGAAIVLDGAGRRAAVPARLENGLMTLTVPAAFLAVAEGEVIVDPLLTTFSVDSAGGRQSHPDVAFDATNNQFLFVYEDVFSGTDTDIYRRTLSAVDDTVVSGGYIESGTEEWTRPETANLNHANSCLVVAQRTNGTTGFSEVVGRILDMSANTLGPELVIGTATSNWNNFQPDVGGNQTTSTAGVFMVVWERRFSATLSLPRARTVQADGTLGSTQFFEPSGMDLRATEVRISESAGAPATVNTWNVVYRMEDLAVDEDRIRVTQFNGAGAITSGPSTLYTGSSGERLREIDVSEGLDLLGLADATYLVTYDSYFGGADDKPLMVCRGDNRLATRFLSTLEHASTSVDAAGIRLGATADDFLVSYMESTGGGDYQVLFSAVDLTENTFLAVSERRTFLGATTNTPQGGCAIASRRSGGLNSRWSACAWSSEDGSGDLDIDGARHFASNAYSPGFQFCTGNVNSTGDRGFIAMYGNRNTTDSKTLVASFLPPNSFGYFINGTGFTSSANPGGSAGILCIAGGILGRYSNAVMSSGPDGSISLTVDPQNLSTATGTTAAVAGQIWNFQAWHRDSVGGSPTSNFTNAVTILFE